MLKALLQAKRHYLDHFFEHVDVSSMEKMLHALHQCRGGIFFSGVGKSGLVAQKIAVTMASTGTRALFLSPTDALHGDIGLVSQNDLCVLISKSGESQELLNLVPHLQQRGVCLVAVVSNPSSRLSKLCNLSMHLPLKKELCPFDLVPTTSAVIQLILGDVLAVGLMQLNNFDLAQYSLNHPSGRIGKRSSLKVKDLMRSSDAIPKCAPQAKLVNILYELSSKQCGCILVVSPENNLLGIFTDGDLRRALEKYNALVFDMRVDQLMNPSPRCTDPEELAWEALKTMESIVSQPITVMPVVLENKQVVGLLKMHDVIQAGL